MTGSPPLPVGVGVKFHPGHDAIKFCNKYPFVLGNVKCGSSVMSGRRQIHPDMINCSFDRSLNNVQQLTWTFRKATSYYYHTFFSRWVWIYICKAECLSVLYAFRHGTTKWNEILQGIPFHAAKGNRAVFDPKFSTREYLGSCLLDSYSKCLFGGVWAYNCFSHKIENDRK